MQYLYKLPDYQPRLLLVAEANESGRSLFVVIRFIAFISSVAISLFVMSIPCVVSTLPSASWFIIFAFTFTGMVLSTLPFAINIALTILLAIAFLIRGSNFIKLELLPRIEFVV